MELVLRDGIMTERDVDMDVLNGLTAEAIVGLSNPWNYTDTDITNRQVGVYMTDIGVSTKCMEKEGNLGLTVDFMKATG